MQSCWATPQSGEAWYACRGGQWNVEDDEWEEVTTNITKLCSAIKTRVVCVAWGDVIVLCFTNWITLVGTHILGNNQESGCIASLTNTNAETQPHAIYLFVGWMNLGIGLQIVVLAFIMPTHLVALTHVVLPSCNQLGCWKYASTTTTLDANCNTMWIGHWYYSTTCKVWSTNWTNIYITKTMLLWIGKITNVHKNETTKLKLHFCNDIIWYNTIMHACNTNILINVTCTPPRKMKLVKCHLLYKHLHIHM